MATVNFTNAALPVSDFEAWTVVEEWLKAIPSAPRPLETCNMLVFNIARALCYERGIPFVGLHQGMDCHFDGRARSMSFWSEPSTQEWDMALEKLLAQPRSA